MACLASHDLPTFSGWRSGRDIEVAEAIGQLSNAEAAARKTERAIEIGKLDALTGAADEASAAAAAHGFVAGAPSRIMLVQADDLAGERDPLNVPGTDTEWPNWRRRVGVPVERLAEGSAARAILAAVKQERTT